MKETRRERMRRIYWEGREAHEAGIPIGSCPYDGANALHWRDGWEDREADHAALSVPCPECGASTGEPCRLTAWDMTFPFESHGKRVTELKRIRAELSGAGAFAFEASRG